jgi:hypothetical protein
MQLLVFVIFSLMQLKVFQIHRHSLVERDVRLSTTVPFQFMFPFFLGPDLGCFTDCIGQVGGFVCSDPMKIPLTTNCETSMVSDARLVSCDARLLP